MNNAAMWQPIDLFYVALYDEERSLVTVPLHYERGHYQTGTLKDISERPGTIGNVIRTRQTLYLHDNIESGHRAAEPEYGFGKSGKILHRHPADGAR